MRRVLERRPWDGDFDPIEGFILRQADREAITERG
jgi:hypothetical protein